MCIRDRKQHQQADEAAGGGGGSGYCQGISTQSEASVCQSVLQHGKGCGAADGFAGTLQYQYDTNIHRGHGEPAQEAAVADEAGVWLAVSNG